MSNYMDEKLVFHNFPYGEEAALVDVYCKIENRKTLYILLYKDKIPTEIFKLVAWKGGSCERIYINEKMDLYRQLGFIEVCKGNIIDLNLDKKNELNRCKKNLLFYICKFLYKDSIWHYDKILPIKFNVEKEIHVLEGKEEFKIITSEKKQETSLVVCNNPMLNNEKKQEGSSLVYKNEMFSNENKQYILCVKCKFRGTCFKKYKVGNRCDDFCEGAAVGDYSQWDSRY